MCWLREWGSKKHSEPESVSRQPLAHPGIEVVNALPVKRMAGTRRQVQFRAAKGGRDFLLFELPVTIKPALTNVHLLNVLDAIVMAANKPIKYSIEDYAVVFSARTGREPPDKPFRYCAWPAGALLRQPVGRIRAISDNP